ncbi:serine hydrolase domain-containing protein [Stackebrandtia soli]|uniref:serine hydrolase domain-containing protein n=1 Tax=Stackebrandtia soli TaxID=1892856 RepID=UPI0039E95E3F
MNSTWRTILAAGAVGFIAALSSVAPASANPDAPPTPDEIDAYVQDAVDASGLPGVSIVVTYEDTIVRAAGYGHDSNGDAVTADTPMRTASLSKAFTATAVMRLVDEGAIALDEPVTDQLPEFRMADKRYRDITVRHLLNQTSGLTENPDSVDIVDLEDATSLAEMVERLGDDRLSTDPGSDWAYCNVNYDLAARLVEVVTGLSFDEYMERYLFGPLGMNGSANSDEDVPVADGHNSVFGVWVSRAERAVSLNSTGSGSVITTANDLGRWLISQGGHDDPLISDESRSTMQSSSDVHKYGMGWGVYDTDHGRELVHSGNLYTYNAVAILLPDTGYGIAVMSNGAPIVDDTYAIGMALAELTRGETPEPLSSDRLLYDLILAALAVGALILGVLGAVRSRRWATRRAGLAWWRVGLRFLPSIGALAFFAAFPDLISLLIRRTALWDHMTYFAASLTYMVAAWALAGALVLSARSWALWTGRATG